MNLRRFLIWTLLAHGLLATFVLIPLTAQWWNPPEPTIVLTGPAGPLTTHAEPLPREALIDLLLPSEDPFASKPASVDMLFQDRIAETELQKWRNPDTGWFDLRPLFQSWDIALPENAVAQWNPDSEYAIFQLPSDVGEYLPDLFGNRPVDAWNPPRLKIGAKLLYLKNDEQLSLAAETIRLADLEPYSDAIEVLDEVQGPTVFGQRSRYEIGDREIETERYRNFEFDPILGADESTIDLNIFYELREPKTGAFYQLTTQVSLSAGYPQVIELSGRSIGGETERLFLVIQADRLSRLGEFWQDRYR